MSAGTFRLAKEAEPLAANKRPKRKRTGSKALVVTRQIFGHLARIFVTLFLV